MIERGLRSFVRATHAWPGAKQLYGFVYQRAAQAAGRLVLTNPLLLGIYARNSYALGTSIPGLSDIDLTVIWRNASRQDLNRFHAAYDRLRGMYPMLGETEMVEARHLPAWTTHGVPGLEARRWRKLGGEYEFQSAYAGDERLDGLRQATAIYRYNLSPLVETAKDKTIFSRAVRKLFRQLGKAPPDASDPRVMMALCLRELSAAISEIELDGEGPQVDYVNLLGPIGAAKHKSSDTPCLAALGREDDPAPRYILVPAESRQVGGSAVVMDPCVFRFYLCFVDPLEYFSLLLGRTCFSGADVLAEPFPLSRRALRQSVRHYAVQMLTFAQRRDLETMPAGDFRNFLYGWYLRTLRFFEDGKMRFPFECIREYFGKRHLETETRDRRTLLLGIADELAEHLLVSER